MNFKHTFKCWIKFVDDCSVPLMLTTGVHNLHFAIILPSFTKLGRSTSKNSPSKWALLLQACKSSRSLSIKPSPDWTGIGWFTPLYDVTGDESAIFCQNNNCHARISHFVNQLNDFSKSSKLFTARIVHNWRNQAPYTERNIS